MNYFCIHRTGRVGLRLMIIINRGRDGPMDKDEAREKASVARVKYQDLAEAPVNEIR